MILSLKIISEYIHERKFTIIYIVILCLIYVILFEEGFKRSKYTINIKLDNTTEKIAKNLGNRMTLENDKYSYAEKRFNKRIGYLNSGCNFVKC